MEEVIIKMRLLSIGLRHSMRHEKCSSEIESMKHYCSIRYHAVPFSKMLTFFKSEAFCVEGEYNADVPFPTKHIGLYEISK